LVATAIALCVLGAAIVWMNRYEVSSSLVGPIPMAMRLDRFTGQVIGCIPGNGCIEMVPSGTPALRDGLVKRAPNGPAATAPGSQAAPAGNTAAPANAAPAAKAP
jgi:hypothetical protein